MSTSHVTMFLWAAALSSGVMAGVYLAFSGFIMRSFNQLGAAQAIAAMNAINITIVRSVFMPVFFASTIFSMCLIVASIVYWDEVGAGVMLIAGVVYLMGMFFCTVVFNVPLNNSLATFKGEAGSLQQVWDQYYKVWTGWNHVRVISSIVTCITCIWLLSV